MTGPRVSLWSLAFGPTSGPCARHYSRRPAGRMPRPEATSSRTKPVTRMKAGATPSRATRLLILSPNAGAMSPDVESRLRSEFSDHLVIDFDPSTDFRKTISPRASVVVAGGDGHRRVRRQEARRHSPSGRHHLARDLQQPRPGAGLALRPRHRDRGRQRGQDAADHAGTGEWEGLRRSMRHRALR